MCRGVKGVDVILLDVSATDKADFNSTLKQSQPHNRLRDSRHIFCHFPFHSQEFIYSLSLLSITHLSSTRFSSSTPSPLSSRHKRQVRKMYSMSPIRFAPFQVSNVPSPGANTNTQHPFFQPQTSPTPYSPTSRSTASSSHRPPTSPQNGR